MRSTTQQARFAGLLYVVMIAVGLPTLILVPSRLIVRGDAAATADHIRGGATLYRIGIASELAYPVVFVLLALALYRLFERVNKNDAIRLVLLVCLSVPIVYLNTICELAALNLVSGPSFLSTFSRPQLDSLAYLFVRLHSLGIAVVTQVFWGLWLVPFGRLVMRSGFIPKILGVSLLVAASGYVLRAAVNLFPAPTALESLSNLLTLGELPIIFWLVIWGAREERVATSA